MILLAVVAVFVGAGVASAYDVNAGVSTDKSTYAPGETVYWTMYAWTSTSCPGISLLALNLHEDQDELLSEAEVTDYWVFPPGFWMYELTDSYYGLANGFTMESDGVIEPTGGKLADLVVRQSDDARMYGKGANDDPSTVFAKGEFVANVMGIHNLSVTLNGANNWGGTAGNPLPAEAMGAGSMGSAQFEVVPEPATMGLLLLGALALIRRRR